MQSNARTVREYLESLPSDRKEAISAARETILKNLPKGFEEVMQYGMISYVVPLSIYPPGYLGKKDMPLPYISLASQKNYMAIYFMGIYSSSEGEGWFKKEYQKSGKKLDMGKSCVRFKKLEDLPLPVIGKAAGLLSVNDWIAAYENARGKK